MVDTKISTKKAVAGSIDGAIATLLTLAVVSLFKYAVGEPSTDAVAALRVLMGGLASTIVLVLKRYIGNYCKHK